MLERLKTRRETRAYNGSFVEKQKRISTISSELNENGKTMFYAKKYVSVYARGSAACTAACATGTLLITAGGLPVYSISHSIITMPPWSVHIESACGSN